jgi:hypothetical protein
VPTPEHRILWELERLTLGERMTTLVQVMQRLGMTTQARPGALSRGGIGWIAMGAVLLGLTTGMLVWRNTQAHAQLDLTTVPADALVLLDGDPVHDPRTAIVRRPGSHTLTVSKPGYIQSERKIVLGMLEPLHVRVQLEPSPDTGFELTNERWTIPVSVWLDGDRIKLRDPVPPHSTVWMGKIAPGPHVLEVKPELQPDPMSGSYGPWRQVIVVEPHKYTRVHAVLEHFGPPCSL